MDYKRRIIAEFSARNKAKGETAAFRRDMKRTTDSVKRMAGSLLAIAGIGGGIYGLKRAIGSVTAAAIKQEEAEISLAAALGDATAVRSDEIQALKAHAAALQNQTIYGDEAILSQMAYAKNLGVTADKLDEAATAAIGLAAKYRIELSAAMMLVGRASMGQTQMLTRYGIVLDASLSDQEKFNQLLRMGADSFYLAQAATRTARGSMEQLKNTWGDIKEDAGPAFLEILKDTSRWLKANKEDLSAAATAVSNYASTFISAIAEIASGFESLEMVLRGSVQLQKTAAELMGGGGSAGAGAGIGLTGAVQEGWSGSAGYTPRSKPSKPWVAPRVITAEEIVRIDERLQAAQQEAQEAFELERQRFFDAQGQQASLDVHNERLRQFKIEQEARQKAAAEGVKANQKIISSGRERMLSLMGQVHMEIELLGKLDEPRQHARQAMEFQAAAAAAYSDNAEAATAATERFRQKLNELAAAQRWNELAQSMEYTFADSLERIGANWHNMGKIATDTLRQIGMEAIRIMAIRPAAQAMADVMSGGLQGIWGAISGGGRGTSFANPQAVYGAPHHRGGIVGQVPATRDAQSLRSDERLIIGQVGEEISQPGARGSGGGDLIINIENNGQPVQVASASQLMGDKERTIKIVLEDSAGDGEIRHMVQDIVRQM